MSAGASRVAVSLGSNLGDRSAHLRYGILRLHQLLADLAVSSVIETEPVGVPDAQEPYLNAAVVGTSVASPRALLEALVSIERARGRTRPHRWAARTLDLDLILVGATVIETPELSLPHPRFRERLFVLGPLCEIAPDMREPVTGLTLRQLLMAAKRASVLSAT